MFHKDTLRLIRKTRKRFVTIFLIVLIGVGFMVGLMCSAPTMRKSVDRYYDKYNFMDVQLYSSYGFDDRDIDALKESDIIAEIFPTRFVDTFTVNDESTIITRVQEIDSDINRYELLEGRMPQGPREALALGSASFGTVFHIGDKVELYLEDSDLGETLSVCEYEIVGIIRTPQYMCSSKETSTLDNLLLSTVIYVDNMNFKSDYYTSVYLTFKGADEFYSFDDEYKEFVEENVDKLKGIINKQEVVLRDEIIKEITQEVENGEKELNEKITQAQAEIDDGKKQLEDAYIQLLVGEAQLEASEKQLADGEKEIAENETKLADAELQIAEGIKQIEAETGMSFEEASNTIKAMYSVYSLVEKMADSGEIDPDGSIAQTVEEKTAELEKLTQKNADLVAQNSRLQTENGTLVLQNAVLERENQTLEQINASDLATDAILAQNNKTIKANNAAIDANKNTIDANSKKIAKNETAISKNSEKMAELGQEISQLEGVSAVVGTSSLNEFLSMIDEMAGGDIKTAYDGIVQLETAQQEVASGKEQIAAAKTELANGRQQLVAAKAQLASGRTEYEKGAKELEDAQKTLDEEYEKARIELDKARQQLSELPDAQWTVLDRDMQYANAMFENNADQMQRIGDVFPLLFCLVAALVCMTTMKRLVDEERSQIGVFSALGFSKGQITGKYMTYALSASLLGSVVGLPIGVLSLPYVIYFCWKLMYDLPPMVIAMPAYIAVIGVCLFTFLMLWVTFTVVRGVLKECPSQLMRPKAPRTAKKVFLEKIPFIWKRLSFTSKVTARNIIRYKSRFFMTVIGVAGCTSLLVLGFAIKGSISQVITLQYGNILMYDTTITLEDADHMDKIYDDLLDNSLVEHAVPYMTYSSMAYSENEEKAIQAYIMDGEKIANVIDLRDRRTKEKIELGDGVVISEKYATLCGIKEGDEIVIESSNGIKESVEVTDICEMYTQHFMFISTETYEDLFDETVHFDSLAVLSTDSSELIRQYDSFAGVKTIDDFTATISMFSGMLDSLDIIVVVIIIAAGSLALVVIMNLTEVNISERIREIATLKVLGFNNKEVYSYIFKEVFLLSLIGMVIGLPLAKLELEFVMSIIEMEMVMFSTVIQPLSYIYGLVIIMIFTILVIMLMRKTLRNVQMVESLKSVE